MEANPLLGRNPSLTRLLGLNIPLYAFSLWAEYEVKKDNKSQWWVLIPIAGTAAHGIGAVNNGLLQ